MADTSDRVTDRIEKEIVLRAPRSRVWRAITNSKEFGEWFRVDMKDEFKPGAPAKGRITHPGYEHLVFEVLVERMDPEKLFSFRWHPYAVDPKQDYSKEPTTLVVFELQDHPEGTRLRITESGFDQIPVARRAEAFRMNSGGWEAQTKNIATYVSEKQ
ncbi:MAG TPA: SRPBCC family protein [Vicinamibacteria bacterium]